MASLYDLVNLAKLLDERSRTMKQLANQPDDPSLSKAFKDCAHEFDELYAKAKEDTWWERVKGKVYVDLYRLWGWGMGWEGDWKIRSGLY